MIPQGATQLHNIQLDLEKCFLLSKLENYLPGQTHTHLAQPESWGQCSRGTVSPCWHRCSSVACRWHTAPLLPGVKTHTHTHKHQILVSATASASGERKLSSLASCVTCVNKVVAVRAGDRWPLRPIAFFAFSRGAGGEHRMLAAAK